MLLPIGIPQSAGTPQTESCEELSKVVHGRERVTMQDPVAVRTDNGQVVNGRQCFALDFGKRLNVVTFRKSFSVLSIRLTKTKSADFAL